MLVKSLKWILRGVGGPILAFSSIAMGQTAAPVCNALVNAPTGLDLVSTSGAIMVQFMTGSDAVNSASIAPDEDAVVFIPADNGRAFTVVREDGASTTTVVPPPPPSSLAALIGVTWDSDSVVRTQNHEGQLENSFQFFRTRSRTTRFPGVEAPSGVGQACAMQIEEGAIACVDGNSVSVTFARGGPRSWTRAQTVYTEKIFSPEYASQLAAFPLTVGSAVTTQTVPSFTVQLVSVSAGITLQIETPTGQGLQERTDNGSAIAFQIGDELYGIIPTITDARKGIAQVAIVKSGFTDAVFDPAIAWQDDEHVMLVERMPNGPQLRLIRTIGAPLRPPSAPIGVSDRVQSMRLVSEERRQGVRTALLVFRTTAGFGYVPVSVSESDMSPLHPETVQVGPVTNLPNAVTVEFPSGSASEAVLDWSCK